MSPPSPIDSKTNSHFDWLDAEWRTECASPLDESLPSFMEGPPQPTTRSATDTIERPLGPTELAYFLSSRLNGSNDLFVCWEVNAPVHLITPARLLLAWAILRLRHPLTACKIVVAGDNSSSSTQLLPLTDNSHQSARFVLTTPQTPQEALESAQGSLRTAELDYTQGKIRTSEDLVWEHNNGPRVVSEDTPVLLRVVRGSRKQSRKTRGLESFIFSLTAAHCVTDRKGLYVLTNELFELLGGGSGAPSSSPSSLSSSSSSPSTSLTPRSSPIDTFFTASTPPGNLRSEFKFVGDDNSGKYHGNGSGYEQQPRLDSLEALTSTLRHEWVVRYGMRGESSVRRSRVLVLPLSIEERVRDSEDPVSPSVGNDEERPGFEKVFPKSTQAQSTFPSTPDSSLTFNPFTTSSPRDSIPPHPSTVFSAPTSIPSTNAQQKVRDIMWSPEQTREMRETCQKNGVPLQAALFAACNIALIRATRWRDACAQAQTPTPTTESKSLNKKYPIIINASANFLQSSIPPKSKSLPTSEVVLSSTHHSVALPGDLSSLSIDSSSDPFNFSTSLLFRYMDSSVVQARHVFWSRARDAARQGLRVVESPEFSKRARQENLVEHDLFSDSTAILPAALEVSLNDSIDSYLQYASYPLIQPTFIRTSTRKPTTSPILLTTNTFRGALHISLNSVPSNQPSMDSIVGPGGFLEEFRTVLAEMLFDHEKYLYEDDPSAEVGRRGLDVSVSVVGVRAGVRSGWEGEVFEVLGRCAVERVERARL